MSPFDRARINSYIDALLKIRLYLVCVVSEIFNVVKYRDLEIMVKIESMKVIESGTIQ